MKNWRIKTVGKLFTLAGFLIAANLLQAQSAAIKHTPRAPSFIAPMFTNNPVAMFIITNLLAEPKPELSVPAVATTASHVPGT